MFKIGDFVTRNSYNNDIVFKIIDISSDIYILKGYNVRLVADSYKEDLKIYDGEDVTNDEDLIDRIDEISKQTGRTRNEIIQRCIEFAVDNIIITEE